MERLIQLAEKIKDSELKKNVIELLKNPELSHEEFKKYPREEIERVKTPFTVVGRGSAERSDLVNHIASVTEACIKIAENLEKNYGLTINMDYLIAGSLLHDIMKVFEWEVVGNETKHTGILLDHSMLAVAELYHRGFPEGLIHIIASHIGETGPTPPRSFEALILHHVDSLFSMIEFHLSAQKEQPIQLLLLDEETMKKIAGEITEKA
ncbi:MAG: HDIG domain-containing protein [Candidatus Aenigmatarchaeota archaeon]